MAAPPEYFNRVAGSIHIDFPLLQGKRVTVVGVGQVGSLIAVELAKNCVGNLVVIDPDVLERSNLYRHALDERYLGWNKAEGITEHLDRQVVNLTIEAVPFRVEPAISDRVLASWLSDADLIVAATDDPDAQKRIGHRALNLGIPAIFPALYPEDDVDSGEVLVQLGRGYPCYGCWTGFREGVEHLRAVTATSFGGLPVIFTTLMLCIALLDPEAECVELLANGPGRPPCQAFILSRFGMVTKEELDWRTGCPACGGGPIAASRSGADATPASITPTLSAASESLDVPKSVPYWQRRGSHDVMSISIAVLVWWLFFVVILKEPGNVLAWIPVAGWILYLVLDVLPSP